MKKAEKNKIANHILVNFYVGVGSYLLLYLLNGLLMGGFGTYALLGVRANIMYFIALLFLAGGIVFRKLSKTDEKYKNYSCLFFAYVGGCLIINLWDILPRMFKLFGMTASYITLVKTSPIFKMLSNSQYLFTTVALLGVVYLLGMLVYNLLVMNEVIKGKK